MRPILKQIIQYAILLAWLPLLNGCDEEDDVVEIFTGKVWKLNRLNIEGNSGQFLALWNTEQAYNQSMTALRTEGNYTIEFTAPDANVAGGDFTARGIRATVTGQWNADGKSHTISITAAKVSGNETDPLAKEFVSGLQKLSSYEGDSRTLTLKFAEGQNNKIMGLMAQ